MSILYWLLSILSETILPVGPGAASVSRRLWSVEPDPVGNACCTSLHSHATGLAELRAHHDSWCREDPAGEDLDHRPSAESRAPADPAIAGDSHD